MVSWKKDTNHSRRRRSQRGISVEHVEVVRRYGRQYRQPGGRVLYYLGRREVVWLKAVGMEVGRYKNLAVVFSPDGFLVTAFRSSDLRRARMHGLVVGWRS